MIALAWIVLMGLLLYKNYYGNPLEKGQIKESFDKETIWYDIYAGERKIGFAKTSYEKAGSEIIIKNEQQMKVIKKEGGKEEERVLMTEIKCLSDSSYATKSLEYSSHFMNEKGVKLTGKVDGGDIVFFLESETVRRTHKVSTGGKNFYLPATLIRAVHLQNPATNSSFQSLILNISSLTLDEVKVTLEEIRPITVRVNVFSTYKYKVGNYFVWTNDKGVPVKEEYPLGIRLFSEPENISTDPAPRTLFDYTGLPYFNSNKILTSPEGLKFLKVKIDNFSPDKTLYDQSSMGMKDGVLEIKKENADDMNKNTYALPYSNSDMDDYLKPDDWVLSTDRNVYGNALQMAAVEKNDAFRMSRYLTSNLYFTVGSIPSFALLNSNEIFKTRVGDYIGRTVMFASFGRAAGLPTRMVSGFVYRGGFFYFHTWPEVWFGKWIPVDPSLAQFPADVTHIPLKTGTLKDIVSIIDKIKDIKIEILEAS